jgi:hypothetical protein
MSKHKHEVDPGTAAGVVAVHDAPAQTALLPKPLYVAFILVIVIGALIFLTRETRLVNGTYNDISNAEAATIKYKKGKGQEEKLVDVNDGLLDEYGSVVIKANNESVGSFLSLCDINPPAALQVFRRSLDDGNKSAKMIALYSTFYMVPKCALDDKDLQRVIDRLDPDKEKDDDIRRVAQKTLSDLIVIKSSDKTKFEALPADIKSSGDDWPANNVVVREEKRGDVTQLRVRWSNPNTAFAWWKLHGAGGRWLPEQNAWELQAK